jgi:5-methylcytosine-specific restriction endonuclease McrA
VSRYQNYSPKQKATEKNRVANKRVELKLRAIEYKGGKCSVCGYNKSQRALQFHHLNPKEKDFTLGSWNILSWDKIKAELDKCILVCANCHAEIEEVVSSNRRKTV